MARTKGALGRRTIAEKIQERHTLAKELARRTRALYNEAKRIERHGGAKAGPAPPRDDYQAAMRLIADLLVRAALTGKGDARAAIHLDERMNGRVKHTVEHGGIPGGEGGEPIQVQQEQQVIYRCLVPRRPPRNSA